VTAALQSKSNASGRVAASPLQLPVRQRVAAAAAFRPQARLIRRNCETCANERHYCLNTPVATVTSDATRSVALCVVAIVVIPPKAPPAAAGLQGDIIVVAMKFADIFGGLTRRARSEPASPSVLRCDAVTKLRLKPPATGSLDGEPSLLGLGGRFAGRS
jgi:hypothetical protein